MNVLVVVKILCLRASSANRLPVTVCQAGVCSGAASLADAIRGVSAYCDTVQSAMAATICLQPGSHIVREPLLLNGLLHSKLRFLPCANEEARDIPFPTKSGAVRGRLAANG